MSASLLVQALVRRLQNAGYISVATPFRVATIDFDFTAALRGSDGRSLDLVLIVDTSTGEHGDRDSHVVRRRVEALSRALDVTQSRYVLTVILAGAMLTGDIDTLAKTCRVLTIEKAALDEKGLPVDIAAAEAFDDHIRLLPPLDLSSVGDGSEGAVDAISALSAILPKTLNTDLSAAVFAASAQGEEAVKAALAQVLAKSLRLTEEL